MNYDELLYRINKDKKSNKTSIDLETGQDESDHDTLRRLRRRQNDYTKALRSHSVFNHNRTISTQIEPVREGEYHEFSDHLRRKDLSAEQRKELLIQEKIYQRILGSDLEENDNRKIAAAFKGEDRAGSGFIGEAQFVYVEGDIDGWTNGCIRQTRSCGLDLKTCSCSKLTQRY